MPFELEVFRVPANTPDQPLEPVPKPRAYAYGKYPPVRGRKDGTGGLTLAFNLPAGGRGESTIHAWVNPKYFSQIADLMMENSSNVAEKAFLSAMLKRRRRRAKGS